MDYLNGLPPALRSGLDGALAVADPVFSAKAALTNLGPPSRCGCTPSRRTAKCYSGWPSLPARQSSSCSARSAPPKIPSRRYFLGFSGAAIRVSGMQQHELNRRAPRPWSPSARSQIPGRPGRAGSSEATRSAQLSSDTSALRKSAARTGSWSIICLRIWPAVEFLNSV
jgi:hypothetical protein